MFRLSRLDKEQEARHLALARAAIARGRKVLTHDPRPEDRAARDQKAPPQQPDVDRIRIAIEERMKLRRDRHAFERQQLSVADRHLAKAEHVIRQQVTIIEKLYRHGHDAKLAEETMTVFEANLHVLREHRELIIRAIEDTYDGR
jgi:hypothetical protein